MNDDRSSLEARLGALGDALDDALDQRPLEPSHGRRGPAPSRRLLAVAAAALVAAGGAGIWAVSAGGDDGPGAVGSQVESTPPTTTPGPALTTVPPTGPTGGAVTTVPPTTTPVADPSAATVTIGSSGESTAPTDLPADVVIFADSVSSSAAGGVEGSLVVEAGLSSVVGLGTGVLADAAPLIGDVAVIAVGYEGPMMDADLDAYMDVAGAADRVVVVTVHSRVHDADANNELIRGLPERYPNVVVLPWDLLADLCPGDCFASDGIHLNAAGARYYAGLIALVAGVETNAPDLRPPTTAPGSEATATTVIEIAGTLPSTLSSESANVSTTVVAPICSDGSEPPTYVVQTGDFPAKVASNLDVELADLEIANAGNPAWDQWLPGSEIFIPCE